MHPPETRYTNVGDAQVAYQIVGDGPIDLVYIAGQASNVDVQWELPHMARALERLASFSRLIVFDRRGQGLSDPVRFEALSTWEHWTEDLTAVLDAAGSKKTAILAAVDGGLWGLLFSATYPERTSALVLWNAYARSAAAEDYPIGLTPEFADAVLDAVARSWGTEAFARTVESGLAEDETAIRWVAKFLRASCTPASAVAQMRYQQDLDLRHVLPAIRVPTLVLHRQNRNLPLELGRYIADHIPGARFEEIPGVGLGLEANVPEETFDLIEEFVTGIPPAPRADRVLATVLFTDIVRSTEQLAAVGDRRWKELLEEHGRVARSLIESFGGNLVKSTGDGLLARFDLPGRAIRCALELSGRMAKSGVDMRTGLHTGEVELMSDGDVGGIAVHIAQRVMSAADAGEVFCTRTVKDLVAGSGIELADRGTRALKGVPDEWQLFALKSP